MRDKIGWGERDGGGKKDTGKRENVIILLPLLAQRS
jgi:hypothetical protein